MNRLHSLARNVKDSLEWNIVLQGQAWAFFVAALVVLCFIPIDSLVLGDMELKTVVTCLKVRGAIAIVSLVFSIWNYKVILPRGHSIPPRTVLIHNVIGLLLQHVVATGMVVLGLLVGGAKSNYFTGLAMVFIGLAVMVPWHPIITLLQIASMILTYIGINIFFDGGFGSSLAVTNLVFLFGCGIISGYGAFVYFRITGGNCADSQIVLRSSRRNCHEIADAPRPTLADGQHKGIGTSNVIQLIVGAFCGACTIFGAIISLQKWPIAFSVGDRQPMWPIVWEPPATLASPVVVYLGQEREHFLFRNTLDFPISLEHAQVVYSGKPSEVFEIYCPPGKPSILPGKQFQVYFGLPSNVDYSINLKTNRPANMDNKFFQIIGIRVAPL